MVYSKMNKKYIQELMTIFLIWTFLKCPILKKALEFLSDFFAFFEL